MNFLIVSIILCLFLTLVCVLGTGSDEKNLKSFYSYPKSLQQKLRTREEFIGLVGPDNKLNTFIANFIMFLVVLFLCGISFKKDYFLYNFLAIFILGMIINLFDLIFLDLIWWRNTKRIRFSMFPDKKDYSNPRLHFEAFFRATIMYLLIALIDGFLLTLF